MSKNTEINYSDVEVVKKIKEKVVNVRWAVENFTEAYSLTEEDPLHSSHFKIKGNLFLLLLSCLESDDDDFLLVLAQHPGEEGLVNVKYDVWLEDLDGKKHFDFKFFTDEEVEGIVSCAFKAPFQRQDLGTSIKLRDNVAIICCEIRQCMPEEEILKFAVELPQKLWDSYQQGLVDSITIQVGGKTLTVSKNILAANSDVFERMLLTPSCKEVQEGTIKIIGVSFDAMNVFIEYLHRGQIENLSAVCDDLFVLSHRYMVAQLQENCAKEMIKSLNKENLFGRLQLAFTYDQKDLKNAVLNYVTSNGSEMNVRQIMKSSEWHELASSNEVLANEITDAIYDRMQWFPEQTDDETPNKRQKLEERH